MAENQIDIHPITRWKRTLVFLGDFFICLILNVIFLAAMVQPLMALATNLNGREQEAIRAEKLRDNVLYSSNLLFYQNEDQKYSYDKNLSFTFDRYLSYFLYDEEHPDNMKDPSFGHQINNDIFRHYYIDIRNDNITYKSVFSGCEYFTYYDNLVIKEEYKEQLRSALVKGDELSKNGQSYYDSILQYFLGEYSLVIKDIKEKDLVSDGQSFVSNQAIIDNFKTYENRLYIISDGIAFILSWSVVFILLPFIFDNGQTLTMKIMKIYRVGVNNLYILKKSETLIISIYYFAFCLACLLAPPLMYVPFYYLFNLPLIVPLFIISLVFVVASFIIMLFNSYRRTAIDLLSRSVLISEEDFNKITETKGYVI